MGQIYTSYQWTNCKIIYNCFCKHCTHCSFQAPMGWVFNYKNWLRQIGKKLEKVLKVRKKCSHILALPHLYLNHTYILLLWFGHRILTPQKRLFQGSKQGKMFWLGINLLTFPHLKRKLFLLEKRNKMKSTLF